MTTRERTPAFREDLCNLCGKCLQLCPVLNLPLEEAKKEVERLIKGEESKYVLDKCNTCLSCNLYCPQEANPYQLILERWNDKYKKRGAPPLYRFVCPTEVPNIWQLLNLFLSNRERRWIYKWMNSTPKSEDTILLLGNYTHLFPFIIGGSKLLENLKPIDKIDQWEGGAYLYQGGYLDIVQKIAERCKRDFDNWGAKNIIHLLDAVQYIFSEVHPKEMGVQHDKNFINFNEWMLEKLNSGDIKIKENLNLNVTIHDNCFSKSLGGKYWDPPRKILEKCGCIITEMEHIKDNSLCCGFGAGASWVKNIAIIFDIISEGSKKFKEAEKTGASALISYCTGCLYLLWATKELLGSKIDIFHIVEVIRMAIGEKLEYPKAHINRTWDIIAIMTYQLFVSIFQKNFYISRITYNKDKSTYQPKKYSLLRIMRFLFNIDIVRKVYAKFFRFLMTLINTR